MRQDSGLDHNYKSLTNQQKIEYLRAYNGNNEHAHAKPQQKSALRPNTFVEGYDLSQFYDECGILMTRGAEPLNFE